MGLSLQIGPAVAPGVEIRVELVPGLFDGQYFRPESSLRSNFYGLHSFNVVDVAVDLFLEEVFELRISLGKIGLSFHHGLEASLIEDVQFFLFESLFQSAHIFREIRLFGVSVYFIPNGFASLVSPVHSDFSVGGLVKLFLHLSVLVLQSSIFLQQRITGTRR